MMGEFIAVSLLCLCALFGLFLAIEYFAEFPK